ncbi:hypothetical protein HK405_002405 [Cladochytrium tenue]|nr:hypothetical protein HK405_002405 [Cladochytrium tenue]
MVTSVPSTVDPDVLHLDIELDAIGLAAGILSPSALPPIFTSARLAHDLDEVERLAALLTDLGAGAPDANARSALTRLMSLANTRDFLPAASRMFQYAYHVLQERAENCAGGACRSANSAISDLRRRGLLQKDDLIALPKSDQACGGRFIIPSFYLSLIDSTTDKLQMTDIPVAAEPMAVTGADKSAATAAFATPTSSVEDLQLLKDGESTLIAKGSCVKGPQAGGNISDCVFSAHEHQPPGEQCCKLDTAELARMGLAPRAAAAQQQLLNSVAAAAAAATATAIRDQSGQKQHLAAAPSKRLYPFVRPLASTTSLADAVDADVQHSIAATSDRRPGPDTRDQTKTAISAPKFPSQQSTYGTLLHARVPTDSIPAAVIAPNPHSGPVHVPQSLLPAGGRKHSPAGVVTAHPRPVLAPPPRLYGPPAPRATAALFAATGSTAASAAHSSFPRRSVSASPLYPTARGQAPGLPSPVRVHAAISNGAHHGPTASTPYYNRAPTYYGATASVSQWLPAPSWLSTGTSTTTKQRYPLPSGGSRPGAANHRNPAFSAVLSVAAAVQAAAAAAVVGASGGSAAAGATTADAMLPAHLPPAPSTRKRRTGLVDEVGVIAVSATSSAAAEGAYIAAHHHVHHPGSHHPATSAAAFVPRTANKRTRLDPGHQPQAAQQLAPAQQPRFASAVAAASGYSSAAAGSHLPPPSHSSPVLAAAAGSQRLVSSPQ